MPTISLLLWSLAATFHAVSAPLLTIEQQPDYIRFVDDTQTLLEMTLPTLGEEKPQLKTDALGSWLHVELSWEIPARLERDDLALLFRVFFKPDFWWAPYLAPTQGDVIAQHVFRSPAILVRSSEALIAMIPDLDLCGEKETPWYMDMDAEARHFWLGMSHTDIPEHVRYQKTSGLTFEPGTVRLGFYLGCFKGEDALFNPWEMPSRFLWQQWAHKAYERGEPSTVPPKVFIDHSYRWAFDTWADAVWQEFDIDGVHVGGPAFIVNVTESPNYPGEKDLREFLSLWNQAWFSTLRVASGMYRYGRRTKDESLMERARLSKEFTLAAPLNNGLFPTVYRTEMEKLTIGDEQINRSKGWESGYWTNANRVPREHGIRDRWHNVLDMSWTCLLLLRWHRELEADPRIPEYVRQYGERLLTLQDEQGFFPSWLHPETEEASPVLAQSPQTSMSVSFLLALAEETKEDKYADAALKAMDAVIQHIIPKGQWEDFETYWSCCRLGQDHLGKPFERNAMFKQCSFSMFWTAEALFAAWQRTNDLNYRRWGKRTLDELSMVQQVWQPPFIHVPALGGFGVMNFDAEWNDARQSLFAELFLDYAAITGDEQYWERGMAALKASFVMMYCPENPAVKALWEKVWPFFGPEDYGFTMENYGHGGTTSKDGEGMGSFTIFSWGNGAAAEAWNRVRDHYGPDIGL
ncbi:MAG: hypothetical protein GX117_11335 [Candidatus Hydrogenedentes bacterium]|nr:hypothetical protein [Candidatus Hydrogenedentota bacterium]